MGAPAAPMLAEIVDDHLRALARFNPNGPNLPPAEKLLGYPAHRSTMIAVVSALCRLGPDAKGELDRLLEIERRNTSDGFVRVDWDCMMVRLGKPVEIVSKPENITGSEANYQRNLRGFVAQFDPATSC